MQNGSKYVPPHLRNQGGGSSGGNPDSSQPTRAGYGSARAGYGDRRSSYNDRGGNRPGGPDGEAPPVANSRWNNVHPGSFGGGGGGGYEHRGHRGGGGGYRRDGPRRNELGFHGDMKPDKRLENQLFRREDRQTTGINFDNYDDIPVETSGHGVPDPIYEYSEETIGPVLFQNTQLAGYTKPTPVQKYSVPIGALDRDLMACAQTGSGKTAGFLFPIIMSMLRNGGADPPENARRRVYPTALILAPTRELASQIQDEAKKFTYTSGIASVVVYGGADIKDQLRQIERGCDLLVATPGRLVDLIERGRIAMENIKFLVLDEADRMLDMGFEPQIRRIVEQEGMPHGENRSTMMFSATFPTNIQRLASDFLRDYIFLTVGRVGGASKDVSQTVEYVENNDKPETLMRFLLTIEEGLILIFVETKRSCDYLEDVLCGKGFPACSIHGDKSQREREESLRSFKRGITPVMVATDVASRGLDIPNVTQVVNFDLPNNIDDYVHRIGRTGRAGNTGAALSFVNERNAGIARELYELLDENDQEIPSWFKSMCNHSGGGGGRGGRRNNRSNFGGRDYRTQNKRDNYGGHGGGNHRDNGGYGHNNGGGYGGYGGGGGGGYGGGNYGGAW